MFEPGSFILSQNAESYITFGAISGKMLGTQLAMKAQHVDSRGSLTHHKTKESIGQGSVTLRKH